MPSVGRRMLVQAGRGLGRPARENGWGEGVRADIVEEKGSGGGGGGGVGGTTSKFPSPLQCRKHYTQRPTETRFSLRRASGVPRRSSHTHAGVSTGSGMSDGAGPGVLEAMGGGRCSAASHLAALGTGSSFTGSQAAPQLPCSRSAVHPPPATGTRRERGNTPGAGGGGDGPSHRWAAPSACAHAPRLEWAPSGGTPGLSGPRPRPGLAHPPVAGPSRCWGGYLQFPGV